MIPEISDALEAIVGQATVLQHANGAGRIFELFLMSSVARGPMDAGFAVWLQRSDGSIIEPTDTYRRFIQRGGAPTGVAAAWAGPDNASVIGFRWRQYPAWEIWNGIQFEGRSYAQHEIDLAIVPQSVGAQLRLAGGTPTGRPRVAIECKDVGAAGSLDEMRAFVARLYDVTLLRSHHPHLLLPGPPQALHPGSPSGPAHRAVLTYRQENRRTKNIIARRTGFVSGVAPLAAYHQIEPHQNIVAGGAAVEDLVWSVVNWARRHA
ncbi:hypothetical protein [Caulobacter sp. FWC2]|uniref:hypothetical protein n=1 Tax=Caulobacter sp. FWC2 TaxID=69664 RepID=UPI000C159824|nr:hypothetical protein [Caulobacter sp. FWC2]PIB92736.1 hypothetical protein CSW62_14890 [Caulobacter sp. FWC2]